MFKNHLKIAFRNILKDRSTSFINLFGLTIGLTSCLLIGVYIWNEVSFDTYHSNAEQVHRVNRKFFNMDGSLQLYLGHVAPPIGPLLKNDFPDIEVVARLFQSGMTIRNEDVYFNEQNVFFAEPAVFEIFDIPVVSGDGKTGLDEPYTAMISEHIAEKYFGSENPVGKTFQAAGEGKVMVAGVFEDFPFNSHLHPDILLSFVTLHDENIYGLEGLRKNWGNNSFSTYIRLPKNYPTENLITQFPDFLDKHLANVYGKYQPSKGTELTLTPLTDIHLHSHLDSEIEENGDMKRVKVFLIIAILILLIACINYMNLATARAANRAREIGIKKVVGARRGTIVGQFLSEAFLLSFIATILSVMLAQIGLPFVNEALGQELQVTPTMLSTLPFILFGVALFTGLVSGIYPAVYLSGLKPISAFKSALSQHRNKGGLSLRKVLVVSQFSISAALIIATAVVYRQLDFMQTKDLGFDKDHVVNLGFYSELTPQYESFKNGLVNSPYIKSMARSSRVPSGRLLDSQGSIELLTQTDTVRMSDTNIKSLSIDDNFVDTYGLKLAAGRNYEKERGTDKNAFLINQAGAENVGFENAEDAIGKYIRYGGQAGYIIGVVENFNFESLHQNIQPMIFYQPENNQYWNLSVKVDGTDVSAAIGELEKTWIEYLPQFPFDYQFVDDRFGRLYEAEKRQSRVFIGFAILAIFIACLGLFGLTAFVARQRVKEIGIRKVLGATTTGIVAMLSRDFLKPVLISLLIAAPIAYYFMDQWLQDFAYRINIDLWVFILAGAVALMVAFVTVGFQSVRAALANPVDSLRGE